ncbi:uncharacterized protein UTRI_01868 [Ustilago trichophora]|uniref:Uncharacterized protein n=1 Tax=Ustilago trichophora TaxID=86804 RepID=A0A5C3DZU1_9BASI|nr:uncharacterized protein UTRI_01868 [Ustilago trichophora]
MASIARFMIPFLVLSFLWSTVICASLVRGEGRFRHFGKPHRQSPPSRGSSSSQYRSSSHTEHSSHLKSASCQGSSWPDETSSSHHTTSSSHHHPASDHQSGIHHESSSQHTTSSSHRELSSSRESALKSHQHSKTSTRPLSLDDLVRLYRHRKTFHPATSTHSSERSDAKIDSAVVIKRGVAGLAGDIEYMGLFGSILAIPGMLSIMGFVTDYNLEKSYFNSELNLNYWKQSRDMLRAHTAALIKKQEQKFAQAGTTWNGMIYNADGRVNPGAKLPSWAGRTVAVPEQEDKTSGANGAAGGNGSAGAGAGAGTGASAGTGTGSNPGISVGDVANGAANTGGTPPDDSGQAPGIRPT